MKKFASNSNERPAFRHFRHMLSGPMFPDLGMVPARHNYAVISRSTVDWIIFILALAIIGAVAISK